MGRLCQSFDRNGTFPPPSFVFCCKADHLYLVSQKSGGFSLDPFLFQQDFPAKARPDPPNKAVPFPLDLFLFFPQVSFLPPAEKDLIHACRPCPPLDSPFSGRVRSLLLYSFPLPGLLGRPLPSVSFFCTYAPSSPFGLFRSVFVVGKFFPSSDGLSSANVEAFPPPLHLALFSFLFSLQDLPECLFSLF